MAEKLKMDKDIRIDDKKEEKRRIFMTMTFSVFIGASVLLMIASFMPIFAEYHYPEISSFMIAIIIV